MVTRGLSERRALAVVRMSAAAPVVVNEHGVRMKALRELESFIGKLLVEANEITTVFYGLFAAIGVTAAERENVKNLEALLDTQGLLEWREHLQKFGTVQRKSRQDP